ncbi:uncharacterized protein LOC115598957 [Calypte anna]|uniref:uncharacterized protein LOC115598957 n=1 Tax=Calypte anna TaxID=9244 RepID=UPI0011C4A80B|nr:uncharacterized protein LOC115598957 [Calypte anna]
MQQWQSFELANVPVLQRLYVVPLNAGAVTAKGRRGMKEDEGGTPLAPEACYLCGEECGKEARPVAAKITNGNAKSTMHFPFLSLLPCPPGAKGLNKHWEVSSCRKCFGVLQDLWAMYRACHNEELITSVQSFLGRYHQVFSAGEPGGLAGHPAIKPGATSVCYICGAELGAGKEFQLNVNPPGRFGEKEPFFPFLTVYPPAPRARPADSTGLVATCVLCYHDLLGQWLQHEGRNSHHPSSAWSRQYKVETFVCFFCRQEKKRCLGLKAVQVARLPVFLYTLRVANSLLVDDGKHLTIGACAECGAVVLAGKSMTPAELLAAAPPALLPKVSSSSLETAATKPAASEPRHRAASTGERSPGTGETLPRTSSRERVWMWRAWTLELQASPPRCRRAQGNRSPAGDKRLRHSHSSAHAGANGDFGRAVTPPSPEWGCGTRGCGHGLVSSSSLETAATKPAASEPRHRAASTGERSPGTGGNTAQDIIQRTGLDVESLDAGATRIWHRFGDPSRRCVPPREGWGGGQEAFASCSQPSRQQAGSRGLERACRSQLGIYYPASGCRAKVTVTNGLLHACHISSVHRGRLPALPALLCGRPVPPPSLIHEGGPTGQG